MTERELSDALRDLASEWTDDGRVRSRIERGLRARLRRRRVAAVVGSAAAAAVAVVGVLAVTMPSDDQADAVLDVTAGAPTAPHDTTVATSADPGGSEGACDAVPFQPTWLPPSWSMAVQSGLGGASGITNGWHWAGPPAGSINVGFGSTPFPFPLDSASTAEMQGRLGTVQVGEIHEGFAAHLDFPAAACTSWYLNAYGISRVDFERVVSSLVSTTGPFAIWPEDTPDEAVAHRTAPSDEAWRLGAEPTARQFASEVLGWGDPSLTPVADPDDSNEGSSESVLVEREPGGPSALISLAPLVDGQDGAHWYVVYVGGHSDEDLGASISVGDGAASVRAATDRAHMSVDLRIGHGTHQLDVSESTADFTLDLPYETVAPGHFLVIWRDGEGRAAAAWGNALPAGTFAAG